MTTTSFGFIGIGRMGAHMARRLLNAGHSLTVFDRSEKAVEELVGNGAERAGSAAEVCSRTQTVFLSLPTPDIVQSVCLGEAGVIAGTTVENVVDCSTTGPQVARIVAAELAKNDIVYLDAPVSGGVAGARAGTLAVMAACSTDDFGAVEPLLKNIGRVFHVGAVPGMGQMMKLLNNLLSAAAMVLTSEVAVAGVKAGLDPAAMMEIFNAGSGRNSATQDKFPRTILTRRFDYGFTNRLMAKDVNLCLEQMERLGLKAPAANAVRDTWLRTLAEVGADEDFTTVVKLYERQAGVEVKGSKV